MKWTDEDILVENDNDIIENWTQRLLPRYKFVRLKNGFGWISPSTTQWDVFLRYGFVYWKKKHVRHPTPTDLKAVPRPATAAQLAPFYELALCGTGEDK